MNAFRHLRLAVLLLAVTATAAAAQPAPDVPYAGNHCTTINGFGGVAWSSSEPGGLFGGAFGWEVQPWFGLEANAAWLDRPAGEDGFTASLDAHFKLPAWSRAVPFAKTGLGVYHASFETEADVTPAFYHRRMQMNGTDIQTNQSFTDPALVLGGGVSIFLSRHVSLRPDIEAIIAMRDGDTHVVTALTVHLAYHFEDHPITSTRTGR